jgi:hypothetical protein
MKGGVMSGWCSWKRDAFLFIGLFNWLCVAQPSIGGTTYVVTNLNDSGPGSLRDEIAAAHSDDTISLAVSGTIVLTNGELLIARNLRIIGPGAANLAISAGGLSRVMEIPKNATVTISNLTICDGRAPDGAAGSSNSPVGADGGDGGGIYNAGSLTLAQCVVSSCAAGNGGNGFVNESPITPTGATNWFGGVGGNGGAIYNAGKLALANSRFIANFAGAGGNAGGANELGTAGNSGGGGGAIYNVGAMRLSSCIFDSNAGGRGGAGYIQVEPIFSKTIEQGVTGGTGGSGGAIYDAGQGTTVSDCQFSFNISGTGGMGTTGMGLTYYPYAVEPARGGLGGNGGAGGAIFAENSMRISGCTFLSNQTAPGAPGGIGVSGGGAGGGGGPGGAICALDQLAMTRCQCASNHTGAGAVGGTANYKGQAGSGGSGGSGGAVYAASSLSLTECTFSINEAGNGAQGGSVLDSIYASLFPGKGGTGGSGGAIHCESKLTAADCTFDGNHAGNAKGPGAGGFDVGSSGQRSTSGSPGGQGGAIFGSGPIALRGCTVSGNVGGNGSDADFSLNAAVANKTSKIVSGNPADANAQPKLITYSRGGGPGGGGGTGGIHSENGLNMVLCTLSGNIGGAGGNGGRSYGGYMQFFTGAGGAPGGVGAIDCDSSDKLVLVACTIAGNRGGAGGTGGGGDPDYSGHTGQGPGGVGGVGGLFHTNATAINSIIAANFGGAGGQGGPFRTSAPVNGAPDVQGVFTSLGHNLIGKTDGASGFTNGVNGDIAGSGTNFVDPILGPLADNGGPTFTMALLHGSPALDAGDNSLLRPPYGLKTDQRGFARKSGAQVDIGAFEFQYQNGGATRTAQPVIVAGGLVGSGGLESKAADSGTPTNASGFRLSFNAGSPGATFSVLATSDLSVPVDDWKVIGQAVQVRTGIFEFNDADAANHSERYYRVSAP